MADLIERLRTRGTTYSSGSTDGAGRGTSVTHFVPDRLCAEAAARIAELEAEAEGAAMIVATIYGERDAARARVAELEDEVQRLRQAVVWYADEPEEHASVEAWTNWFRDEPASRFSAVLDARSALTRLAALKGEA